MAEFFLPFLIGYSSARILSHLLSSSTETAVRVDAVLLRWDKSIFGWRTTTKANLDENCGEKYMVAYPVSDDFIRLMKSRSIDGSDNAR